MLHSLVGLGELAIVSAKNSIEIDASPVYELLMCLQVFASSRQIGTYQVGPGWFTEARRRMSAGLREAMRQLAAPAWLWPRLLGLAHDMPAPKTVSRFIALLADYEPLALGTHIFGGYSGNPGLTSRLIEKARRGNATFRADVSKAAFPGKPTAQSQFRRLLAMTPLDLRGLIGTVIGGWYRDVFRHQEAHAISVLAAEVRAKQVLRMTSPDRFIVLVTNGLDYTPGPGIRKVTLIPSLVIRPWVVAERHRSTQIVCYPADDEGPAHPDEPSPRLMRLQRALVNADRLRILRQLTNEIATPEQLSRRLGKPVTEIRSHLVELRAARLIDLELGEHVSRVCPNVPSMVYRALRDYLPTRSF